MASVSLDSIRSSMEKKYASYDIDMGNGESVVLLNPMRLAREKRQALLDTMETFQNEDNDEDPVDLIEKILSIVSRTDGEGAKLKAAINGDLPILMEILTGYLEEQKVGEASSSAN